MAKSTILRIERILLVTLQDDATSSDAADIVVEVGEAVIASAARGVLIDVSTLSLVDSYMGRMLGSLIGMTKLMGAQAVIAGIRPEVAIAMVELGVELPNVATALNIDIAMAALRQRIEPGA
jgi:rsbT antagonist protein RsbS